jgi:hypothetical protein
MDANRLSRVSFLYAPEFGPNLVCQEPIWSQNVSPARFLRERALESGGLLYVEAAAIEPAAPSFAIAHRVVVACLTPR